MAVGANRSQIVCWIEPIALSYVRERNDMVELNIARSQFAVASPKAESADDAVRSEMPETFFARASHTLIVYRGPVARVQAPALRVIAERFNPVRVEDPRSGPSHPHEEMRRSTSIVVSAFRRT